MTELQGKMLHLQTISTIMSDEKFLMSIVEREIKANQDLDMKARYIFRLGQLAHMREILIDEILENKEFYAPLEYYYANKNNNITRK